MAKIKGIAFTKQGTYFGIIEFLMHENQRILLVREHPSVQESFVDSAVASNEVLE